MLEQGVLLKKKKSYNTVLEIKLKQQSCLLNIWI